MSIELGEVTAKIAFMLACYWWQHLKVLSMLMLVPDQMTPLFPPITTW